MNLTLSAAVFALGFLWATKRSVQEGWAVVGLEMTSSTHKKSLNESQSRKGIARERSMNGSTRSVSEIGSYSRASSGRVRHEPSKHRG